MACSRASSLSRVANPVRVLKAVEAHAQAPPGRRRGVAAIGLEISVQPPDAGPNTLLGPALVFAEGVQLVHQALCMHPAQCMAADVELEGTSKNW